MSKYHIVCEYYTHLFNNCIKIIIFNTEQCSKYNNIIINNNCMMGFKKLNIYHCMTLYIIFLMYLKTICFYIHYEYEIFLYYAFISSTNAFIPNVKPVVKSFVYEGDLPRRLF